MLYVLIGVLAFLAVVFIIFLYSAAPNRKRRWDEMKPFEERMVAHRGLFDNDGGVPENSISAFKAAVDAGYGIEFDVWMTCDGELVVFHDESTKRMCGKDLIVANSSYHELNELFLLDTDEKIPRFEDVLSAIGGEVPIIVEIKPAMKNYKVIASSIARIMDSYNGKWCVESFNPFTIRWFKKNRPDVIRGQLSTNYFKDDINIPFIAKFMQTNLMTNFLSRPDFIAYNCKCIKHWSYRLIRKIFKVKNFAWTIKNDIDLNKYKKFFDAFIFDGFSPPVFNLKNKQKT